MNKFLKIGGKKKTSKHLPCFLCASAFLLVSGALETSSQALCKTYPQSDVYCDSDSCRKTWVLVRTRGRKWEVPNVSAIKKQNQKILWSQASVVFSLFCLLTLLGGFQEELQNSTQHHPWWEPPWELAGHIPIRLSVWGELWPWCRQLIWLHEPVPKVMYVKHGQAD